ncbi:MAG: pilus assembly protein PilP [Gammaproteobacteria bacterium]|nr:MAG: pilus assembly protein PilP [Gammaproteobacteria bacterium]
MTVRSQNLQGHLVLAALTLSLAACISDDRSDLEQKVNEILARKSTRVEKLPEIKPYERYLYQSGKQNLRDPFEPFVEETPQEKVAALDNAQQQALYDEVYNRNKEELEQFELDSLRMVGTIEKDDEIWAIIKDPQGLIYRVRAGNYMGKNSGKIVAIYEDHVELREIVKDAQGVWRERTATLALQEE